VILIPAIDLKEGKCVRLKQGNMDETTVFSEDPVSMAEHWRSLGCRRLHVVDLDGAFAGMPQNYELIRGIVEQMGEVPVQVGGGIRTRSHIEDYLSIGVSAVVVGTRAVEEPKFLSEMAHAFPNKLLLGLDARDGKVATHGWANIEQTSARDFTDLIKDLPLAGMVFTDIERDGMMTGLNVQSTWELAKKSGIATIASGGVHELSDLEALKVAFENDADLFLGAITGRAIYEGTLDFRAGQELLDSEW